MPGSLREKGVRAEIRLVNAIDMATLPTEGVQPHPAYKYPKFVQAITTIPTVIKSPSDLQKCK